MNKNTTDGPRASRGRIVTRVEDQAKKLGPIRFGETISRGPGVIRLRPKPKEKAKR